jgi:hypothetical protein
MGWRHYLKSFGGRSPSALLLQWAGAIALNASADAVLLLFYCNWLAPLPEKLRRTQSFCSFIALGWRHCLNALADAVLLLFYSIG